MFNVVIMKTRLGQQFRAVGQNRVVANAAGINVDKTRIIAIIFSTVLAGLGHLIFAQNLGSLQTYGAHEQVGLYAGAAILVGGASIVKASNGQALLGCLLFHLLFIVVSGAGRTVFGDAAIGEYFRVFISYGVIAVALVMHAWSAVSKRKDPEAQPARRVRKGVNTHSFALFRAFRGRGLFPPIRAFRGGAFRASPPTRAFRGGFSACRPFAWFCGIFSAHRYTAHSCVSQGLFRAAPPCFRAFRGVFPRFAAHLRGFAGLFRAAAAPPCFRVSRRAFPRCHAAHSCVSRAFPHPPCFRVSRVAFPRWLAAAPCFRVSHGAFRAGSPPICVVSRGFSARCAAPPSFRAFRGAFPRCRRRPFARFAGLFRPAAPPRRAFARFAEFFPPSPPICVGFAWLFRPAAPPHRAFARFAEFFRASPPICVVSRGFSALPRRPTVLSRVSRGFSAPRRPFARFAGAFLRFAAPPPSRIARISRKGAFPLPPALV